VILKIVPKAGYHCKKSTNESKGKPEQKFDSAYGTIFRISKCFQRRNEKLHINFSLELGRLKLLKTVCACTESTDIIVQASKENIQLNNSFNVVENLFTA
jgi:hypothetical protein